MATRLSVVGARVSRSLTSALLLPMTIALGLLTVRCASDTGETAEDGGACSQPDQDGVIGGSYTFEVDVSDTAFSPVVLKAQNAGKVTLTVKNVGTKPHDFVVQCLTVQGCLACFPDAAKVGPLDAGASATVTFTAPSSGASCAFPGGATDTEMTNSSGVAISAVCTANTTPLDVPP